MKKTIIALSILCSAYYANAQSVAINTSGAAANASSILDVTSTSKGILIPRMTAVQKLSISSPAMGLMVYQTDGTSGFYYYDGSSWTAVSGGGAPSGTAGGNLGGTYPNPSIASLPAISGANLTTLNASNLSSGTVATARLGSGTANGTSFLRGDQTYAAPFALTTTGSGAATFSSGTLNIPTPSSGGATLDLVVKSTSGQSTNALTTSDVVFNSVITATSLSGSSYSTSTGIYTCGVAGTYLINASLVTTTSGAYASACILVGGNVIACAPGIATANLPSTSYGRSCVSMVVTLAVNDQVKIQGSNGSPSTSNTLSTDGSTRLAITKL